MFFSNVNGQPVPLPPTTSEQPDGVKVFTVAQAADHFGWPAAALEALHETTWSVEQGVAGPSYTAPAAVDDVLNGWRNDAVKLQLREADFGWVKDPDFAVFLAKCHRHGLDPWAGEAFPEFKWNKSRKRMDVLLITPITVLRARAHATNQYVGFGKIQYEYGADRHPIAAYAPIRKLVAGRECEFFGEALWDNFYPGPGTDSLWDEKPEVCLAICAERAGLARAFPQLAGLYTAFEFTKSRRQGPRGGSPTTSSDGPANGDAPATESPAAEPPDNQMGFHLALIGLGLTTPVKRDHVISFFRTKHPGLIEQDAQRFYGIVLAAVRRNPREWGADAG